MGSYLSTQIQWTLEDGIWKVDPVQNNYDAIYILYVELCELYVRWYREQDLMFPDNSDKKTEDAIVLTTPFARMLRYTTKLNMTMLSGEVSSQNRLNTLMVQQHKLEDLQNDTNGYISACMNTGLQHRRDPIAKRTSIAGLEDSPECLAVWGRMPDVFWKSYRVADKATVLSSVDEVAIRSSDAQNREDFSFSPTDGSNPCYAVTEDENKSHYCTVWTLQHLIHHLALLLTVAFPAVTLHPGASKYFLPCNTPYLKESVRLGLSRCYLFVDKDHLIMPSVPTQEIHSLLISELVEIVQSLANGCLTPGKETYFGGVEASISRTWQSVIIGDPPSTLSEGKRSCSSADVLRSRASAARIFNSDSQVANPARYIGCIPMKMLNEVLADANSLALDRQPSHTSSKIRTRSRRKPSRYQFMEEHRLSQVTHSFETSSDRHLGENTGEEPQGTPLLPTPHVVNQSGGSAFATYLGDGDGSSTTRIEEEVEEGSESGGSCSSTATANTKSEEGQHQRRRIPPAMMDLSGDLRSLAPCEITAAMVSQCHREDFDDVNDACRRDDYKKWKRYERNQSSAEPSFRPEASSQHGKSPDATKNDDLWLQFTADNPNIYNQNAESAQDRENKRREQQHKKSVENWEAECHSENEEDSNGVHDDQEFRDYIASAATKQQAVAKLQVIGDVSKKLLQYKPLRTAVPTETTDAILSITPCSKVSVSRMGSLQRLVFSMIWQQLDLQLMSVMSLRQRAAERQTVLSLETVEFELGNISRLTRQRNQYSPLHSIHKDLPQLPPWRVAMGYLAEVTINIIDEPCLKVVACQSGWYLTTATNNIDTHFTTCIPAPVSILGRDQSEVKSSPFYSSVVMLLKDNSDSFRKFVQYLDANDGIESESGKGSPVMSNASNESSLWPNSPIIATDTSPFFGVGKLPFPPKAAKPKTPQFTGGQDSNRKASLSVTPFIDRERKRKKMAESLRTQQQTPVELHSDDNESSQESVSVDDNVGFNILTHGPERKKKRKATVWLKPLTPAEPSEEKNNLNGSISVLSTEIANADVAQPAFSAMEVETISSVMKKDPFEIRNWNLYCDDDATMRYYTVADLLTTGFNGYREYSYIIRPAPVSGLSAFKAGCTVSIQWVHFLDPSVKQARMLFALRSLLEADMTKAANQSMVFQASGIENLCLAIPRRVDYRIRICSAKVLLCVAQNPAAVRMMCAMVVRVVSEVLPTGSYDTGGERPDRKRSGVPPLRSGNLAKLASQAAQARDSPHGVGCDARTDHNELLSIVLFLFASMALSCGRARELMWRHDVGGVAVSLFADQSLPNSLHVGVMHLLRALLLSKPNEQNVPQNKISKLSGLIEAVIAFMKPRGGAKGNTPAPITGLQAVCGLVIILLDTSQGVTYNDALNLMKQCLRNIELLSQQLSLTPPDLLSAVELLSSNRSANLSKAVCERAYEHLLQTQCLSLLFQTLSHILQKVPKCLSIISKSSPGIVPLLRSLIDMTLSMFMSLSSNLLYGKAHKLDKGPLKAFLPVDLTAGENEDKDKHQSTIIFLTNIVSVLVSLLNDDGGQPAGTSLTNITEEALKGHPDFVDIASNLLSVEDIVNPHTENDVGNIPKITGLLVMLKSRAASLLSSLSIRSCSGTMTQHVKMYVNEITTGRSLSVTSSLCTVLKKMSSRHQVVREFLLRRSNMAILWQLIQSNNNQIRISAAECLQAIAYPGDIDQESARLESDCFAEGFLSCIQDEMSALVSLLDPHTQGSDYTGVQVAICTLIASICHFRNSEVLLATEGLLPRLMKMCQSKNSNLLAAATHCIWLSALHMPQEVDAARGIQVLADKLCTSSELADRYIVLTLHALVTSRESCSLSCIQSGIVPHLVKFLGSSDSSVKSTVADTLSTIRRSQRQQKYTNQ